MESKKINQLATELAPELSDLTIIGDPTTGISKKITLSQMASLFTGTVEEYANIASFPLVGTADTIYIALDTNVIYRWNTGTSAYVELSPNIVTSLVFSDANGFDGTISLVGSTATLTITTALTTGSVPFIGASGALSQDNDNLFFDDTNNRLGIGTKTPTTALDVFGSGIIGRINGTSTNNAFLGFASAGTNKWSLGNVQSDHRFRIYSEANSTELVSVLQTGELGIGIANPLTKLHIFGGATALIANLDANTSVGKSISFRSGNSSRINLEVSGTESGSNAGMNFFLRTYTDAGSLLETPFSIVRSTGITTIKSLTLTNALSVANGGTGQTSFNAGNILFGNSTTNIASSSLFFWDDASKRLGVNTSTPTTSLDVNGAGKFNGNVTIGATLQNTYHYFTSYAGTGTQQIGVIGTNSTANGGYLKIINDSTSSGVRGIRLGINGNGVNPGSGSDILTISDGGLVGIGTSSPNSLIHISGATPALTLSDSAATGNNGNTYIRSEKVGIGYNTLNYIGFQHIFKGGGSEATFLTINSAGNVGIGTTSPSYKLSIQGPALGTAMSWTDAANNTGYLSIRSAAAAIGADNNLVFETAGTERARVTSGGIEVKNGILLTADGSDQFLIRNTSDNNRQLLIGYNYGGNYGRIQAIQQGSAYRTLYLNNDGGAVYAGAVRLDTLSDLRMKDNIQPIESALNKVLSITGKKFHLKDEEEGKLRYGFIAQELEGILDEFVIQTKMTYKDEKTGKEVENIKSIENWASSWAALLVEAIKEQQTQIEELKDKIK